MKCRKRERRKDNEMCKQERKRSKKESEKKER